MKKLVTRRVALLVCALMACSLFLVGCGSGGSGTSTGGGAASTAGTGTASTPATGGDDTTSTGGGDDAGGTPAKDSIVYEIYSAPNLLDPQMSPVLPEWHINMNIYDNLWRAVRQDYTQCEPWLVESYELSEDNTDWTIKLREGILFHNGEELTAEDAVFMLDRAREAPTAAAAVSTITNLEVIDQYTFLMEQDVPFAIWPETLSGPSFGVPNKKLVEEHGVGERATIVGSGPYKFVDWDADNTVTIEYFEDYYFEAEYGEPQIKKVEFRTITDANAATIAFEAGEVDVFGRNILLSNFERYREDPDITTLEVKQTSTRGMSMNNQEGQFTDLRVRRAMNHSFDKEAINLLVAEGQYNAPIYSKIDPRAEGYAMAEANNMIMKYEYDVDKAMALLAEAGYDENNPLTTTMISSTTVTTLTLAQAMQDYLAQVNVSAEVETMESAQYMQRMSTGDFECAAAQYAFEYYWSPMIVAVWTAYGRYYNYEQYNNPRVEELIAKVGGTWELSEREPMMAEIIQLVSEDAVNVPIYQVQGMVATREGLQVYCDDTNLICPVFWMHY